LAQNLAIPVKAPTFAERFSWSGPYAGVDVGFGRSANSSVDCTYLGRSPCEGGTPTLAPRGVLGGVEFGYNWQVSNWVFGVATDISASAMVDQAQFPAADPGKFPGAELSSRYDWLGTVRGRGGFAIDNALFYGTGGFAYARVAQQYRDTGGIVVDASGWRGGWTVGAGAEWALDRHWSFKVEYLYVNLQNTTLDVTYSFLGGSNSSFAFKNDFNIARVGLNYRF
jgi:outer membrane immunogenic protein